ncbi:class I adenylate-forming enzyme family protein [Candidatus Poriferisodalis sp.]|uniref:class I adenylate-forming enzyme family protein n=1 Tax=Candidatus Poriferisodalis sp. TaxID=3101277 RepID=UPI003C7017D5
MSTLPVGVAGEVVAMSVVPFEGYLGRPEATEAAHTPDGFARSGDMGIMSADGRLAIVDRVKDMIISGGENVYCAEVERVLVSHPQVAEAAVVGLPDEQWGERVAAAVVPHDGEEPDPAGVIAFVREQLAHYKCPREVMIVSELPRNAMGKVLKPRLAEQF